MSINLDNFSSIQKYYLQQQLPDFSTVKEVTRQKKDHQYYNDNFNIWNNKTQSSDKNYPYYFKQIDQGQPLIEKMKKMEVVDRQIQEDHRKDFISNQIQIDKERLQQRKKERLALQLESMQDLISNNPKEVNSLSEMTNTSSNLQTQSTSNLIYSKLYAKQKQNPLLGTAPHSWNKYYELSKKYMKQVLNPKIIQKDEEAFYLITKKIQKDDEIENLKQQSFSKIHEQTHERFLKQKQKNLEFQSKCGLIPKEKPTVIIQSKLNASNIINLNQKVEQNTRLNQIQPVELQSDNYSDKQQNRLDEYHNLETIQQSKSIRLQDMVKRKLESSQESQRKQQTNQIKEIANSSQFGNKQNQNNFQTIKYNQKKSQNDKLDQTKENDLNQLNNNDLDQVKEDNSFVIQYNNKNNQQSKEQINQINIGDERCNSSGKNTNRRKSSIAKKSDSNSPRPSILKTSMQNIKSNTKQDVNNQIQGGNYYLNGNFLTNEDQKQQNQVNQYQIEREFLTSAESHAKKVNFFNQQNQRNYSLQEIQQNNNSSSIQNNIENVKNHENQSKCRKLDQLSQPKHVHQPNDILDRSEYKGLLTTQLKNVNNNQESEFAKTMITNSQLVNSQMFNQHRPSTQQSKLSKITQTNQNTFSFIRPSTTTSSIRSVIFKNPQNHSSTNNEINDYYLTQTSDTSNSLNNISNKQINFLKNMQRMNISSSSYLEEKKELFQEINNFDKKYYFVKENSIGFSRCNLIRFQQKETFMSAKSALGEK